MRLYEIHAIATYSHSIAYIPTYHYNFRARETLKTISLFSWHQTYKLKTRAELLDS